MNKPAAPPPSQYKAYLGDAVYVDWDGMHLVLTVENGRRATEQIKLDPEVWDHLLLYYARLKQTLNRQQSPEQPE